MPDLPSTIALTTIQPNAQILSADHRNNYSAIQTAVNALIAALSGGSSGQVLLATDSDTIAFGGAYSSYTPVLTGSSSNPTLGSGSSVAGRYLQIGKLVHYFGQITFGTSGTAAGSGTYRVSLPVTASVPINDAVVGTAFLTDSSATNRAMPSCRFEGSNTGWFAMSYTATWPAGTFTNVSEATPWAWAASDAIYWSIVYQAA